MNETIVPDPQSVAESMAERHRQEELRRQQESAVLEFVEITDAQSMADFNEYLESRPGAESKSRVHAVAEKIAGRKAEEPAYEIDSEGRIINTTIEAATLADTSYESLGMVEMARRIADVELAGDRTLMRDLNDVLLDKIIAYAEAKGLGDDAQTALTNRLLRAKDEYYEDRMIAAQQQEDAKDNAKNNEVEAANVEDKAAEQPEAAEQPKEEDKEENKPDSVDHQPGNEIERFRGNLNSWKDNNGQEEANGHEENSGHRKNGFGGAMKRAKEALNNIDRAAALRVKNAFSSVKEYLNPEEKNKRRTIVAGVLGAGAVALAGYALYRGISINGGAETAGADFSDFTLGDADGPAGRGGATERSLPDGLVGDTPADLPGGEAATGELAQPGETIWHWAQHYLIDEQGIADPTIEQIDALKDRILELNGLTEESAEKLSVGFKFKVPK